VRFIGFKNIFFVSSAIIANKKLEKIYPERAIEVEEELQSTHCA